MELEVHDTHKLTYTGGYVGLQKRARQNEGNEDPDRSVKGTAVVSGAEEVQVNYL